MGAPPPLLSIVVPTYNRERYIRRFLEFHLQAFRTMPFPVEIVLSDNCSTDGTAAVLAAHEGDPLLRIVRRAVTGDAYANIMTGYHHARGTYVTYLGDDDFLVPNRIAEYVALLEGDADLQAVYAPWDMLDETRDNAVIGQFYTVEEPVRFLRGDLLGAMTLILERHIFPEVAIYRRAAMLRMVELPYEQSFWAFVWMMRGLMEGDIAFMPEPFARFTAVSLNNKGHVGNDEAMVAWDRYRGGLEYGLSFLIEQGLVDRPAHARLREMVDHFVTVRMDVAARMNLGARNWIEGYLLNRRLTFMGRPHIKEADRRDVSVLAGVQSAVREAIRVGGVMVAVDPSIPDSVLHLLPAREQEKLTRDPAGSSVCAPWKRALIVNDDAFGAPRREDDLVIRVGDCLARYPAGVAA